MVLNHKTVKTITRNIKCDGCGKMGVYNDVMPAWGVLKLIGGDVEYRYCSDGCKSSAFNQAMKNRYVEE